MDDVRDVTLGAPMAGDRPAVAAPSSTPSETGLRRAILGIAIGLSCVLGYFTTYALLVLIVLVAAYFGVRRRAIAVRFDLPAKLFLAAFSLLFISAVVTAQQPGDLFQPLHFAAMLFFICNPPAADAS